MKTKPPAAIIIAVLWLLPGIGFGAIAFTNEFLSSSRNELHHFWYVWILFIAVINGISLVLFLFQRPKSHWLFYFSSTLLLFSGVFVYFSTSADQAQATQIAADFAARCTSSILIFTIAYLPYRERFRSNGRAEQVEGGKASSATS